MNFLALRFLNGFKSNCRDWRSLGMQIRDHPFSRGWVSIKSIFLIVIKANRKHRGRNCPRAGLNHYFIKGKVFLWLKAWRRGASRRNKGKGKILHGTFSKESSCVKIQCEGRRISIMLFSYSLPSRNSTLDSLIILLKETYSSICNRSLK